MKLGPLPGKQVVVEHLAQQRMAEAVEPAIVGDHDLRADRLAHRAPRVRCSRSRRRRRADRGRRARRRRAPAAIGWLSSGSRSTRSNSASRRLGGSGPRPSRPAASSSSVNSGVTVAAHVHALDHLARGRGAEDVGELLGELVAVEALELDPLRARTALELGEQRAQRMAAMELVRAVGREHEHALLAQARLEEAQERSRRPVGPVDVLDPEQQRLLGTELGDQLEKGVEEPPLCLAALGLRLPGGLAQLRDQPRELGSVDLRHLREHRVVAALEAAAGRRPAARMEARPRRARCTPRRAPARRSARWRGSARSAGASCRRPDSPARKTIFGLPSPASASDCWSSASSRRRPMKLLLITRWATLPVSRLAAAKSGCCASTGSAGRDRARATGVRGDRAASGSASSGANGGAGHDRPVRGALDCGRRPEVKSAAGSLRSFLGV